MKKNPPTLGRMLQDYSNHLDLLRLDFEKNHERFRLAEIKLREKYDQISRSERNYAYPFKESAFMLALAAVVIFFIFWIADWLLS